MPLQKQIEMDVIRLMNQAHQAYMSGELNHALYLYQQILLRDPTCVTAYSNLGVIFSRNWDFDIAEGFFKQALDISPNDCAVLNNYSNSLQKQDRLEEAVDVCDQILQQDPTYRGAIHNKAIALRKLGRIDEALLLFKTLVKMEPNHADANFNIGFCLLCQGQWEQAWPSYEWRWRMKESRGARPLTDRPWQGEEIKDKVLLVYNEQGFGDTIQMLRYIPLLVERGAKVLVKCQPQMVDLVKTIGGDIDVAESVEELGDYDYQCPLFSLPYRYGTTQKTIPGHTPYLTVPPHETLPQIKKGGNFKVGFVWSTSQTNLITKAKSIPMEMLLPLLDTKGVSFYSLQVDHQKKELYRGEAIAKLADLSPHIKTFYETARLIQALDLVISVDTAVAHLAGALHKPVWNLLPHAPDWRWGLEGTTTPWYPAMRLYRQLNRGDWTRVLESVKEDLISEIQIISKSQ